MSSAMESPQKYVLGLDIGSASLGWAMIALNQVDEPTSLIRAGVRIYEPGVGELLLISNKAKINPRR